MPRIELGEYNGQRIRVYGTVKDFATYKVQSGRIVPSMLIVGIAMCSTNEYLAEHVWIKKGYQWPDGVIVGSIVSFDASVKVYSKSAKDKNDRKDFKLTNPSNILVV